MDGPASQLEPLAQPDPGTAGSPAQPEPPSTAEALDTVSGAREDAPAGAEPPLPAVTATAFSGTVRLYSLGGGGGGGGGGAAAGAPAKPLLLLLPWLGAGPRALAPYLALYLARGLDVLVARTAPGHVLCPRCGLRHAGRLLRLLERRRALAARPLLVHAASAGAYTFAQMLLRLSRGEPARRRRLARRLRGLVYDSLVTGGPGDMARGIAGAVSSPALRVLARAGARLYLGLLPRCVARHYELARDAFARPPLRCPVLVFYGHDDPLSDPAALHELLRAWRAQGIRVQAQGWQRSRHAAHLRQHPAEYRGALHRFLQQLEGPPCRARL